MTARAFLFRLWLHGATGCAGLWLGRSLEALDGSLGAAAAPAGVLAAAMTAAAAAETWSGAWRSRRPAERISDDAGASPGDRLARHDALTGLPNRHAFLARLRSILEDRRRSDRSIAVLTLDLIDFKSINATLGCAAGDLLLRHASTRLLAALRDTDTLARLGADEFAVIQSDVEDPAGAAMLCERLATALTEPFDLYGHLTRINARIGVALFPTDGWDPDALLQHAGLALDRAKAEQHASFRFYEEAMDAELRERKALERDLVHALEREQFELDYQPQFDIASRRMVGVEALLRWNHPERGRIGPDRFIPLAEDSGLIVPIGAWVLERACAQAVRWHQAGAPSLRMAVNMSPVQFRDPELVDLIAGILARTGLAAPYLELEITERVLMQDSVGNLETLRRLKSLGVRISIDDFGVGHASLGYLRRFPFDEIKVDRSFIGAIEHDPVAAAIVRAALSLGRSLGMVSVAEGVESGQQLTLLDTEGCCIAQGFYFSPPVHPRELEIMIRATASHDASNQDMGTSHW